MKDAFIGKRDPFFWGKLLAFEEENKSLTWDLDLFGNGPEDLLVFDLSAYLHKMGTFLAASQVDTDL